jgi:hypothetical protein
MHAVGRNGRGSGIQICKSSSELKKYFLTRADAAAILGTR